MNLAITLRINHIHDDLFHHIAPAIKHPHVTIAFIKNILTFEELQKIQKIVEDFFIEFKTTNGAILFGVDVAHNAFAHTSILVPTRESSIRFKELNVAICHLLKENGYQPDTHTLSENFVPHITIRRQISSPFEINKINHFIDDIKLKRKNHLFEIQCDILRFVVLE